MIVILDYPERRATPADPFDGSYSSDIQTLFEESSLDLGQVEFFCVFEKQMEELEKRFAHFEDKMVQYGVIE